MDGFAGAIGISEEDGKASPVVHCYRSSSTVDVRYYAYLFRDLAIRGYVTSLAKGIRERSTAFDAETFRSLVVPHPPAETQRAIADYLDTETAHIDALISKKQHLMKLLKERSASFVNDFFIGRKVGVQVLDMMEVDERTLQERPALAPTAAAIRRDWRWTRFGSHFNHVDQRSGAGDERLLSVSKIHGVVPRDEISDKQPRAESLVGYKQCLRGDFIVNQMSAYDGLMGIAPMDGIVTYHYLVFRPTGGLNLDFVKLLLTSDLYKQDFSVRVRGLGDSSQGQVRTPHIRISDMMQTVMPLPSVSAQGAIADCMRRELARLSDIESRLRIQANLLLERRQALITAAVTGELKIPKVAA